ncbi:MAG: MFS transporter [Eubacteriales bacterium]|nr:MFS transporter [Eubacteriales bacterium]
MRKHRLKNRLMANPLWNTLLTMKGNPRICVYTEPLWGVPHNLYAPFASLYMYALGVNDIQIGQLLAIGMLLQVVSSLLGGVLTDKLGRRKTTLVFDIIAWSLTCLIWAFAQNYWWFLAAAVCNSLWQITNISWTCLLVEDSDQSKLVHVYTWLSISGLLAVFFAPISSLLVSRYNMVSVVRGLYLLAAVVMTIKFVILYAIGTETEQGRLRMEQTRGMPLRKMLAEYGQVFVQMIKSPVTRMIVAFMVLFNIWMVPINSFFSLYVTQNLHIAESLIPLFPMVRAALLLVIMLLLQGWLSRFPFRPVVLTGLGVYVASHLLLLWAPQRNLAMLFGYVLAEALAYALITPRKESMAIWFVDKHQRARMNALIYVIMIGLTSPFAWLIGQLSALDRRLPFVLNIVLFAVCAVLIGSSRILNDAVRAKMDAE